MTIPSPQIEPERIITSASRKSDIDQILYGLSIRGVRAEAIDNPDKAPFCDIPGAKPDKKLVVHSAKDPLQIRIAKDSIDAIWDAILENCERAVTESGHCSFCSYDIARLPRPTVCPECGVDVDSLAARRVVRDRRL